MSKTYTKNKYPEELNPFEILNIPENCTPRKTKEAFRYHLSKNNRAYACLAYEMICNTDNYIKNNSKYKVKNKDHFYYVQVGGFEELKFLIEKNPSIIYMKDNLGRSLLYLSARNGYLDICKYLLEKGAKVNETQSTGSTPLHAASYYGNKKIVELLLEYGADTKIKNKYNNLPENETKICSIADHREKYDYDIITLLFNSLIKNKLSDGIKLLDINGNIIGKKIIRKKNLINLSNINDGWISCWHGTTFKSLESIMELSLLIPGSKLKNGIILSSRDNHINRNNIYNKSKDWGKAIFVSPSIFYSLNESYSERIICENKEWAVLVETKIRPNSYNSFGSSVQNYIFLENEPKEIEFRVNSEKDVIVTSLVFVDCSFISNNKNYSYISNLFQNFENNTKTKENIKSEYINDKFDKILSKNCHPFYDYSNFIYFINQKNYSDSCFCGLSIFDKNKYQQIKQNFFAKKDFSKLEKACMGSILGMAVGDAMGARVEFQPLKYNCNELTDMGKGIGGHFKLKPGQWTDDTSMGLCLADSLIENEGNFIPQDIMIRLILWSKCGYNNAFRFDNERKSKRSIGLGKETSGSFSSFISNFAKDEYTKNGNLYTCGNGSIIRNAAIPICYFRNLEKTLDFSKKQSKITHQGEEAAGCCQLLSFIIVKILNGENLKNILDNLYLNFSSDYGSVNYMACSIKEKNGNEYNENWNWKDDNFRYNKDRVKINPGYIGSYCMDAMAMALHILYKTNSFKEAILKAVNLRGDADSLASVVGQIAGAYYGYDSIPKEWIKKINEWDNNEIALRGYILCHLIK